MVGWARESVKKLGDALVKVLMEGGCGGRGGGGGVSSSEEIVSTTGFRNLERSEKSMGNQKRKWERLVREAAEEFRVGS